MNFMELLSTATIIISLLALCVSVVTQVIKGVGIFKKIPTDILVFFLSIAFAVASFFAYMEYMKYLVYWYMVVAAVLLGFFVAFVAMFGWERLTTLWDRYKYKEEMYLDDLDLEDDEEESL